MYGRISPDRKEKLNTIAEYISKKIDKNEEVNLIFICTHNSRRSQMAQLWAETAAYYYGMDNVKSYSGGVEATEFNPKAVNALRQAGFKIDKIDDGENPRYSVKFSGAGANITAFSKKYDHEYNPHGNFAALMVCDEADEACPYVFGAEKRFSIPYEDPKNYDGTNIVEEKYYERCEEIAREIFYVFEQVTII